MTRHQWLLKVSLEHEVDEILPKRARLLMSNIKHTDDVGQEFPHISVYTKIWTIDLSRMYNSLSDVNKINP